MHFQVISMGSTGPHSPLELKDAFQRILSLPLLFECQVTHDICQYVFGGQKSLGKACELNLS